MDLERCEPRGKDVFAVLRKYHVSPALSIVNGAFDPHGLRFWPQDGRTQSGVHSQPRVERQGIASRPIRVPLDWNKRVPILPVGADRGDEGRQPCLTGYLYHRLKYHPTQAKSLVVGGYFGRQC